mgnify:CR=1 FL=1
MIAIVDGETGREEDHYAVVEGHGFVVEGRGYEGQGAVVVDTIWVVVTSTAKDKLIVQAFGREKREAREFAKINASHRDANIRSIWAFSVFFPLVELLSATSVAILLWWGMQDVLAERMTLGILLQFILYVLLVFERES